MSRTDWMAEAVCVGMPVATFFEPDVGSVERAKAICRSCPVEEACLDYAMAERLFMDVHGVWGATTALERRSLRRRQRKLRTVG